MKKIISLILALVMAGSMLTACSDSGSSQNSQNATKPPVTIEIAGLKGATTMGMVKLMSDAEAQAADGTSHQVRYNVTMYGTANEVMPLLMQGELDVAAIPANVAATLYNKTEGQIQVAAVNTLGVLYMVQIGDSVKSIEDLKGKTIYTTGMGTTPEYTLRYILTQNGIDPDKDVTIEFKSEATEVGSMLAAAEEDMIAMLPQPYVSAVMTQNDKVSVALDMTEEWRKVSDHDLVTGVLVVRKDFAAENGEAFAKFMEDYAASTAFVSQDLDRAARLVAKYEIVAKEPMAKKALPRCNIVCIQGEEMKAMLESYLTVLHGQNPASVGGNLPGEDFYFVQ